jgi:hypothetical protein
VAVPVLDAANFAIIGKLMSSDVSQKIGKIHRGVMLLTLAAHSTRTSRSGFSPAESSL